MANRRTTLARGQIVEAALTLLDETGVDGLSTRRLAAALGVKGPSLYWHFASMRELFDHMAEAILADALPSPDPADFEGDWRAWLAAGARGIRRAALSRRDGARILAGARPTGASTQISFTAMAHRLEGEGFSPGDAALAMMALGRFTFGWVLDEQSAARPAPAAQSEAGFEFGLDAMLAGLAARLQASGAASQAAARDAASPARSRSGAGRDPLVSSPRR